MGRILSVIACWLLTNAMAWDATGHKIVATIAYEELTPKARQQIHHTLKYWPICYHKACNDLIATSPWPDHLRKTGFSAFNHWHFINEPWGPGPAPFGDNAAEMTLQIAQGLINGQLEPIQEGLSLIMLTHILADLHQPMHCITRYNPQFPHGDRGGHSVRLLGRRDLHQYWDQGLDAWHYRAHKEEIQKLAMSWRAQYPRSFFAKELQENNPHQWGLRSYNLAKTYAYQFTGNHLSNAYLQTNRHIVEQQVVLAGYRLADLLNRWSIAKTSRSIPLQTPH